MGRLGQPKNIGQNTSSGYTYQSGTLPSNSAITSGSTNLNVYDFVDEYGNVTQIEKKIKESRLKYYIDPGPRQLDFLQDCLIGVSDPIIGDCSEGTALGIGDNTYARAIYK